MTSPYLDRWLVGASQAAHEAVFHVDQAFRMTIPSRAMATTLADALKALALAISEVAEAQRLLDHHLSEEDSKRPIIPQAKRTGQ